MTAYLAALLLAALPIGQAPDASTPGLKTAARASRRILAPETDPTFSQTGQPPALHTQPDDACLCDVSFPDPRHGWAVGDRGVILHTDDGGQHWSPQTSTVACTLSTVCFVDARIGWAAGGMAYPFLHDTTGVVLATRDGGVTWRREPVLLPAIRKLRFVTERQGWAICCSSAMYPGGVLLTRDAGRSWQPACSGGNVGMETGDLYDGRNATLGGSRGLLATIAAGDFARKSPGDCADFRRAIEARSASEGSGHSHSLALRASVGGESAIAPLRRAAVLPGVHAMQIVPPSYGWLAGDGGWVALTGDRGNSWQSPLGKLPAEAAIFDFAAMAVRDGRCWIAGTPGSRVFFTADAGRTWSAASTGVTVPLRAITFADDQRGWAIGQLGTILATSDGGQTWKQQLAAGARAALMAVAGRAEDLPLELIAQTCKERGYFGVAEVIGRRDVETAPGNNTSPKREHGNDRSPTRQREDELPSLVCASGFDGDAPLPDRLHQAMLDVGGCAGEMAWGFPVRPAALKLPPRTVLENWNRLYGGHANDALLGHLVRQIRTWRPDVLVVAAGDEGDGLNDIVRQAVTAASKLAADPAYLADQFRAAGCGPWSVQRVYVPRDHNGDQGAQGVPGSKSDDTQIGTVPKSTAAITLNTDDWSSRLGQSWADAALRARGLLEREYRTGPAVFNLESLAATDDARDTRFNRNPDGIPPTMQAWCPDGTTSIGDIMANVDVGAGGNAQRSPSESGRLQSTRLDALAQRRQTENLFARLEQEPQEVIARLAKGDGLPPGVDAAEAAALTFRIAVCLYRAGRWDLADKAFGVLLERYPDDPLARWAIVWRLQYNVSGTLRVPLSIGTRSVPDTLTFVRQIETACPDLFALPSIRYPLAAFYRRHEQQAQAERLYVLDHRGVDRDDWWDCARGERWLAERKGPPPRPLVSCPAASERPHLDGRLDEALWKKCAPIALTSPLNDDDAWPATVFMAHDDKFLYLAVRCRQAPGANYDTTTEGRIRDADLSHRDRVDIFLDIDRTYASYYHLTIDHRGWAADASCGDRSWNPKWYIAAKTADGVWTAEAAIPLAELGTSIVPGKTIWAVGMQRTVPGVGFQSWTVSAGPRIVPEGFAWVEFE